MILTLSTTPALQRSMIFDSLTIDSVNRAKSVHEYASGKGINVARVAHTLGQPSVATGFLGGDSGAFCRRDMEAGNVSHDFLTVASKTRTCITLIDQTHHTATELVEEAGPVTESDAAKLLVKLELLLQHAKVLTLSGTLTPGCGDDFYARCIRLAHAASVPTILDAKGSPLKLGLREKPLLVKPNRLELSATVDRAIDSERDLLDAMRMTIQMGAKWVVVTNGPAQTLLTDGRSTWKLDTPVVEAVNPIGSGDSFAAGIAVGLMRGLDVAQACVLGVACGAANAMTDFAGHVRREDVEPLERQVTLQRLV
jgi:tagatose 6-phosphate kinase